MIIGEQMYVFFAVIHCLAAIMHITFAYIANLRKKESLAVIATALKMTAKYEKLIREQNERINQEPDMQ